MKKVGAVLGAAALAAMVIGAPATGEPERRTDLVVKGGKAVDRLFMKSAEVDDLYVLNDRHILMRTPLMDYYLISFKEGCSWIHKMENFRFVPAIGGNMLAGRHYEVRNKDDRFCDISGVREVDSRQEAEAIAGK